MRRLPALIAAAGLVAVLAGCSGEAEAPQVPPTEQLAAAKTAFDAAKTVSLTLTSRDVPPRENGVTAAKGVGVIDATEPKFQGTITGTVEGIAATIDAIAIGDTAYLKLFTPQYEETDLTTLNAPNPAQFFNPATGISSLLPKTTDAKAAGQTRSGQDVLDRIDGTLDGALVEDREQRAAPRHAQGTVLPRGRGHLPADHDGLWRPSDDHPPLGHCSRRLPSPSPWPPPTPTSSSSP